jgi:serine/threonine protein kinase
MTVMRSHIGKFEILELLGQGAMGEVYLAKDPSIGREVALKTIRADLEHSPDLKARFEKEAKAAGALHHPHLVTIFEYGEAEGLLFLAMEYVPGDTLQMMLDQDALRPAETLELMAQVCDGLHHAHKHGVIHRDIKPSNVMVRREEGALQAKVMDFGVAKANGSEVTQTGQVVGTLAYMAPEYLRLGKATAQSDLFSVGVMLFEALTGDKPFTGETTGAVVYNIIHDPPRPLDAAALEGVSPSVRSLVERVLRKAPEDRYASAHELAKALRAAKDPKWNSDEDATTAIPRVATAERDLSSHISPDTAPRPSSPLALWVIGGGVIILAAGLFWFVRGSAPNKASDVKPTSAANVHVNDLVLEEAAHYVESRPDHAMELVQAVLQSSPPEAPIDPDVYAVKLMIHYRENKLELFGETLYEAKDRGVKMSEMLQNKHFKAMLEKDRVKHRLSDELRNRLLTAKD